MIEQEKFSYVVSKGMVVGAENVYMETMELGVAKQWCNSNANCKGFTFLAGEDGLQPEDEVTVTFKGAPESGEALHVEPDSAYISYVKRASASSVLGHVGDAAMQLDGTSDALIGHWVGFESLALVFALSIVAVFVYRHRSRRPAPPLLPR